MTDSVDTIDAAVGELNSRYDAKLPRLADLAPGSVLAQLWALPATLEPNPPAPAVFKACASQPYALDGKIDGQLILTVVPAGTDPGPLTSCRPQAANEETKQWPAPQIPTPTTRKPSPRRATRPKR